jgi:hypothetical protein
MLDHLGKEACPCPPSNHTSIGARPGAVLRTAAREGSRTNQLLASEASPQEACVVHREGEGRVVDFWIAFPNAIIIVGKADLPDDRDLLAQALSWTLAILK